MPEVNGRSSLDRSTFTQYLRYTHFHRHYNTMSQQFTSFQNLEASLGKAMESIMKDDKGMFACVYIRISATTMAFHIFQLTFKTVCVSFLYTLL